MTNAIWKGHISFGLVSIPISLYSAEKRTELHFHLLDSRDQARVRYERVNDDTGKEVPWNKVVKAFEFDKNNYVVLSDEDFKRAVPKATKSIDIENFVAVAEIDPIYFERPYYLVPDKAGEKGYVLLRETLQRTEKVAVAKVVVREKQYLAVVMPMQQALVLNLIRFQQELRALDEFPFPEANLKTYKILPQELKMAEQLVTSMTQVWDPKQFHDDYREALLQWIEQKASQGKTKKPPKLVEEEKPANVIDFMAALKESLRNVKKPATKTQKTKLHKTKKRA